ncbi:MAG TPA: hypothetical protein VFC24_17340 [Casimicrobiaceae bacterium]|nr:hypothetical protein [Casimicrobiaceae bacterium]
MIRRCYLAALVALQVMLAWQLVPVVAIVLTRHVPLGRSGDGLGAVLEIACAVICVVGAGLALSFPCVAIMRHVQRGVQRFTGLPHWAVALTFSGTALLLVEGVMRAVDTWAPMADQRPVASVLPLAAPGVALMSSGVLLAEMLRRTRPTHRRVLSVIGPIVRVRREPRLVEAETATLERVG